MSEVTPWFPPKVKPCADRVGPYERKYRDGATYKCWWNGRRFGIASNSPHPEDSASMAQNLPWRGLSSDPSVKEMK